MLAIPLLSSSRRASAICEQIALAPVGCGVQFFFLNILGYSFKYSLIQVLLKGFSKKFTVD